VRNKWLLTSGMFLWASAMTLAVTTVITRHQAGTDFSEGETEKVIVDSGGTLRLAQQSAVVDCGGLLDAVWSVHSIVSDAEGVLYLGTGPNAGVIRYADGSAQQIYPLGPADSNELSESSIRNEHVFAMALDVAGRLLVGVSGPEGKLVRLADEPEVVFEDDRVQYIFAIATDQDDNLYLGTGPEGLVFRLDPFCQNAEVIYDAKDKSILSIVVHDGTVYAGSDERGLVYKIDPVTKRASVLYDSEQDEVPAILVDECGVVYAVSTSAQAAQMQLKASGLSLKKKPGRPDDSGESQASPTADSLNTANSDKDKEEKKEKPVPEVPLPPVAKIAGHVYRISSDGFVTDIFSEIAVLYSLLQTDGTLWLGTGNKGQLFSIDPQTEEKAVAFEDEESSQITSAVEVDGVIYLGLSNPARLVRLDKTLETKGTFESPLIDAGQPARWGKLQIEADVPDGCRIEMACRSGNVKDPNDATFSDWSEPVVLTEATVLDCPVARFCQYRLDLVSDAEAAATPVVRQVTAAHVIPNLAPNVVSVKAERSRDKKKSYLIEIAFAAKDDNKDQLEYTLEFRRAGRTGWIPLKDELDKPKFEWDGRTVEDGRYEVRVTANDRKSNTPETTLTGSRISDVFVNDNSAPEIKWAHLLVENGSVTAEMLIEDAFSVLGSVRYTVDSNEKWITAMPDDLVYDTLSETFTIRIEDLDSGDHIIAFSVADDLQNTRYKTYEVTIP
jgi:outer membrane protein assembly factor BamB